MRKTILAAALLLPSLALAQQWEYKVVHLPPVSEPGSAKVKPGALVALDSGAHLNTLMTDVLNKFAKEGWELIGVTGAGGTSHAAFLRRPVD